MPPPTFLSTAATTFTVGEARSFSVVAVSDVTSITRLGALPSGVTYTDPGGLPGTTGLLPADYVTTWRPGVRGIPVRETVFVTIDPAVYGNGTVEASAGIQAAIDACPAGQVVQLLAGTFLVNNFLLINKAITLRGAGIGPTGTRLLRTDADQEQQIIVGPSRFPRIDDSTAVNLTTDAVKGEYAVTVTSAAGFAAGQFVKLDEDDYTTASFQMMPARIDGSTQAVLQSDRVSWPIHDPPNAFGDLPVPDGLSWHSRQGRPIAEIKEVAGVSGNTVSFTTPIHIRYTTARSAQLVRYTGAENQFTTYAGVEDLVLDGGRDGSVSFLNAAYCWARNVEQKNYGNPSVDIRAAFRIEIRDCYIHDTVAPFPGGGGYAMSMQQGAAECLFENNIVIGANKVIVSRSAGAGSVVAYNYMDDAEINYNLGWQEVGLNGSHMIGSHHILFEGNRCFNYDSDDTWGSAIYMTVFRNYLTGQRRNFTDTDNVRCLGLMFGSWWHGMIGNVLGQSGAMGAWVYEDPGDGTYGTATSVWGVQQKAVWRLGYAPGIWQQSPDLLVRSRLVREGNFDYLTNTVQWDTAPVALPDSLYLSGPPAFFTGYTWPWVDALGGTQVHALPAYDRYTAILAGGDLPVPAPEVVGVGHLQGTPAVGTAGVYPLVFTATNGDGSTQQNFTLSVSAGAQVLSVPVSVGNMRLQGMI